jgi:hypothetical protein
MLISRTADAIGQCCLRRFEKPCKRPNRRFLTGGTGWLLNKQISPFGSRGIGWSASCRSATLSFSSPGQAPSLSLRIPAEHRRGQTRPRKELAIPVQHIIRVRNRRHASATSFCGPLSVTENISRRIRPHGQQAARRKLGHLISRSLASGKASTLTTW